MLNFFYRKTSPLTLAEIYYLFRHFSFFSLNIFLTQAAVGKHLKGKSILSHYNLLTIMSGVAPLSDSIPPSGWYLDKSSLQYDIFPSEYQNKRQKWAGREEQRPHGAFGRSGQYLPFN